MENLIKFLYTYCTDFVINLANLLHLSYYEINALIFVIIWPLVSILLLLLFLFQILFLIKRQNNTIS